MVIGCSGSKGEASDWVVHEGLLGRAFPEAISMACKTKVVKLILLSYTLFLPLSLDLVNCNPQWCPGQKAGSPWLLCLSHFTYISSVQSLSRLWLFATPWTAARQASLSISNSRSLLKLMAIELVMPSNHLILCHPLLLLPSIFPSIRGFSNESAHCIRWPECWSFSFSISPSSEYSGLISFRIDWFDLLTVQGTLKCLL